MIPRSLRRRLSALLAAVAVFSADGSARPRALDIIDGVVAEKGDPLANYVVYLRNVRPAAADGTITYTGCTGTLIARRLVLTAAHCVLQAGTLVEDAAAVSAVFQDFASERIPFEKAGIPADRIFLAQNYLDLAPTRRGDGAQNYRTGLYRSYDLALIRLSADAPEGFAPLQKIASLAQIREHGDRLVVAGYGLEGDGTNGRLKSARLRLNPDHFLMGGDDYAFVVTGRQRAEADAGIPCNGDSGGPLLLDHPHHGLMLAGVHSTSDCQSARSFNVAERVAEYADFLGQAFAETGIPAEALPVFPPARDAARPPATHGLNTVEAAPPTPAPAAPAPVPTPSARPRIP